MSRQAYPRYKPSGVEWLGDVPEHWEAIPLKRTFMIINGSTPRSGEPGYWDGDIPWATPDDLGALKSNTLQTTRRMITQEGYESCGTSLAPAGSLVLSTRAPIGHLAVAGIPLCTNQGCRCLVFRNTDDHRFYYYQVLTAKEELESWGQGSTFKELGRDKLSAVRFLCPPSFEQSAIAAFLDRETARIDTLIEKKQLQIELLQEKRSALISHAVTRGLDPNAPMKDSGIEWLGQIPEHWKMVRFKYVLWLQRGHDLPVTEFHEGEYPVCGSNGCIGYHSQFTTKGPGVTVGRSGSVGEVNYVDTNYWAHNTALYVKEFRQAIPRYAFYLLKTLDVRYLSEGTAVGTLNRNYIHDVPIAIPLIAEQRAIAAFLDRETARIDALLNKVKGSIRMLREYRTALISAAVTGKIDVRREVAA
jgi:type I restriction enzyme S subunit